MGSGFGHRSELRYKSGSEKDRQFLAIFFYDTNCQISGHFDKYGNFSCFVSNLLWDDFEYHYFDHHMRNSLFDFHFQRATAQQETEQDF